MQGAIASIVVAIVLALIFLLASFGSGEQCHNHHYNGSQ